VTIPLFSLRTRRSWGIGEIGDLPDFAEWISQAGISLVQVLPLGEISGTDSSPYAALSAFGIDPMYISLSAVPDLPADEIPAALGAEGVAELERAKASPHVDYRTVRRLKARALRAAHARFVQRELTRGTERGHEFERFVRREEHWLADYTLFRAIKDARRGVAWTEWPAVLAARRPDALAAARALLEGEIALWAYAQWIALEQWRVARAALERRGMEVMGDLPFMVGRDSADVWANQTQFKLTTSVGTPPDVFDPDGQDWDLPPYGWDAMRRDGFAWLRRRARHSAELYHRFRIDHVVGFYRTYQRPRGGAAAGGGKLLPGVFDPATEAEQMRHGDQVMRAMIEAAAERHARIVAEDLGTVPDWVRRSLTELGVAGYRVLIWEKDDLVFRKPQAYPKLSVSCFGTHDTPPVRVWWEGLDAAQRAAVCKLMPSDAVKSERAFSPAVHSALLDLLSGSGSELALLMMQDVLAVGDRINTPGTVNDENWTYRLPAPIEDLAQRPEVTAPMARVRASLEASGRAAPGRV
jgi:4-alpha-glucanotransferase